MLLRRLVVMVGALVATGCSLGIGPNSAASAPGNSNFVRWVRTANQDGVAAGSVRVKAESYDEFRSPIGVHAGNRIGWWRGGLEGLATTAGEMTDMHFDLTVPVFVAPVAVGVSYLRSTSAMTWSEGVSLNHEADGFAARVSYAPLSLLSVDASIGRISGLMTLKNRTRTIEVMEDVSATRMSIGVTFQIVRMFGLRVDLNRISGGADLYGRELSWGGWGPSFEGVISLW